MDNGMATEPTDFKMMISKCRDIQIAFGTKERVLIKQELDQRKNMRRSIISVRDIRKGEIIHESDLYANGPGTGIAPNRISEVIGKTALRDIMADTLIMPEDII